MRQLLQHVSRSFSFEFSSSARVVSGRVLRSQTPTIPYICVQCRQQATWRTSIRRQKLFQGGPTAINIKQFSTSPRLDQEEKPSKAPHPSSSEVPAALSSNPTDTLKDGQIPKVSTDESTVHVVPDEDLPSHQEKLRWKLSKRFNQMMDDLMPKVALASQRINKYTGTDYTGIEALRKEIIEQGTTLRHDIQQK
jgi:sensitive to high expression protein 9